MSGSIGGGDEKKALGDTASTTSEAVSESDVGNGRRSSDKNVVVESNTTRNPTLEELEKQSVGIAPELPPPVDDYDETDGRRDGDDDDTRTDEDDDDDENDDDDEGADRDIERVASRRTASSARSRAPTIVPRLKRRGLFAQLALLPEVERPYDYAQSAKWTITTVTAMAAAAAPMGSSVFYPGLTEISEDFGTSKTVVNLSVAFYMLAMSIFPLWWSSFSETLGRRTIYLSSFLFNVAFQLGSGFSTSIAMLIVFRVLAGGASASVQAVGAGTIADIFVPRERGRGMSIFYLGPLLGPLIGPIIGGVLIEAYGWRSTMWFLAGYGMLVWFLLLLLLPETLGRHPHKSSAAPAAAAVITTDAAGQDNNIGTAATATRTLSRVSTARAAAQAKTKKTAAALKRAFVDPLRIITYLRFPAVAVTVYYAAITFGSLYVLNISVQSAMAAPPYDFSAVLVGLMYVPNSLGYVAASLFGGPWIDRLMVRAAEQAGRYDAQGRLVYLPEDRMRENAWIAATLYPGALIWYGWTVRYGVMWLAPAFANLCFGVGSMLVFSAATTMLTEFLPRRSSSGVALNNFVRNIFSCVGSLITQPLITAMGHGWLMTMVGLLCWVSGNVSIWLLRRNSTKWRAEMDKVLQ